MPDHGVTHRLSSKQSIYENAARTINGSARRTAQIESEIQEDLQVFIDENAGDINKEKLQAFIRGLKRNKHMVYMRIRQELFGDWDWKF